MIVLMIVGAYKIRYSRAITRSATKRAKIALMNSFIYQNARRLWTAPTPRPFAQTPASRAVLAGNLFPVDGMAMLFKLLAAAIVFQLFFYSTTIAMTYLYVLDAPPV